MSDFVRVKDKATGEQLSVRRPDPERFELLEGKPAVDRFGRRLPNKPKTSPAKKAADNPGGEPAKNPEEGSK